MDSQQANGVDHMHYNNSMSRLFACKFGVYGRLLFVSRTFHTFKLLFRGKLNSCIFWYFIHLFFTNLLKKLGLFYTEIKLLKIMLKLGFLLINDFFLFIVFKTNFVVRSITFFKSFYKICTKLL